MQLLRCDRCKKTEAGHINEPREEKHAWGGGSSWTRRYPSITGWALIQIENGCAALLCNVCVERLRAWLSGEDIEKPKVRAN